METLLLTHPLMAPNREALAGNWFTISYAFNQTVSDYGMRVFPCVQATMKQAGVSTRALEPCKDPTSLLGSHQRWYQ